MKEWTSVSSCWERSYVNYRRFVRHAKTTVHFVEMIQSLVAFFPVSRKILTATELTATEVNLLSCHDDTFLQNRFKSSNCEKGSQ